MRKFLFLALIPFIFSCGTHSDEDNVIARVGKSILTQKDLEKMMPETRENLPVSDDLVDAVVSNWVRKEMLYQKAKEYHFDRDEYLRIKVDNYLRDLTIDSYVRYILQNNLKIAETEIDDYYAGNKNSFVRDKDEAKISHAVVKNFDEALKIKSTLLARNSDELDKLFKKYPFETKVVRRGESLAELDKIIFTAGVPNQVYGPIASDYGFHIVEILAIYKAGSIRPEEEVRDEIIQRLTEQKIQEEYNQHVDSLLLKVNYEINQKNISKFLGKE
ncbi:MAG: peptidyl-prolyl cis-trans isomerase [Candidatus Marinimicrobia bacterium]|nr:peptidyl-prolyl cis-trans isomerase [Candidatus Neomarinimicrobiota bacterium]